MPGEGLERIVRASPRPSDIRSEASIQFNTPNLAAAQGNFISRVTAHLISQGKQSNAVLKLDLHVVINGQGVQKVVIDAAKGAV